VHANRHAFEAVLADISGHNTDELWCLGDLVGYGADPDACVELAIEHASVSLAGNHDLAAIGALAVDDFSELARVAAEWTREHASEATLEYLNTLTPSATKGRLGLYHASPRDPVWEYVVSPEQAAECFAVQPERVALIGHSHLALAFSQQDAAPVDGRIHGDGDLADWSKGRWLLNPGSVGQPRDGDRRAAWLELDLGTQTATYHRVEYDIEAAIEAIVEAGLPPMLGERLRLGQ
jgi:diadenosine tetraphosphatase ApaH/serine/threonine PP2A family protein phosphatase